MNYEYKILEQKILSLPSDLQQAMVSTKIAESVQDISDKYELHIDQGGALAETISLTILGLIKAKDFVLELSKRAEIDTIKATEIAKDVNTEIFNSIRSSLQKIQASESTETSNPIQSNQQVPFKAVQIPIPRPTPPNLPTKPVQAPIRPTVEQAGQFTTIKTPPQSPQYNSPIKKEDVLKSIEDPAVSMVDHLLTTPLTSPNKTETTTPVIPKKPIEPYKTDPYKEVI